MLVLLSQSNLYIQSPGDAEIQARRLPESAPVCLLLAFIDMLVRVPILMYHGIAGSLTDAPAEWSAQHTITNEAFRA